MIKFEKSMRTDPHRPGAIIPTDYEWLVSFGMMSVPGEEPDYYGLEDLPGDDQPWANIHEGIWRCDVCGARYNHGVALAHRPTGQLITIGHDCASKYSLPMDLAGWKEWHAAARDKRARAAIEMKHARAAREWREANPAVAEAIDAGLAATRNEYRCPTHGDQIFTADYDLGDDEYCRDCQKALRSRDRDRKNNAIMILTDMAQKLRRYGSLSEKQAAFAVKLGETVRTWQPPVEGAHVPAPEGRVTFTGRILSIKERDGYMGGIEYKMTVKVETPDGSWLAWMTAPSGTEKGQVVNITATLSRSRDEAHFAFGKRPVILTDEELAAARAKEAKAAARAAKKQVVAA
jgi:hypothetical protein